MRCQGTRMLWMIQGRNNLRELLAALIKPEQRSCLRSHGQGTRQAHEDPKDHLRFICCLSVTRAQRQKPLLSPMPRSVTQPKNSALSGVSASGNLQSTNSKYTLQTYKAEMAKGLLNCSGIVQAFNPFQACKN